MVFPNGASNLSNTNDLTENTIINSITLSGSGYTLSGNRIILGQGLAGITDSVSSGGNEIALDVRLDATRDIVVTNSGETLTISGRIEGVGGINKEGVGKIILSGANTFGGILKINVGVVNAQNDRALGTILAGTEVVGNAALELQGNINISYEALTIRGYGVNNSGALRNISGNNSYGGQISSSALGTEITSDSGILTVTGGVSIPSQVVIDGAGDITFSTKPIINANPLTKNGAGTLTFNFPNFYTGTTIINQGTLLYGVDNAISTGQVLVTGGTLDIATYSDIVGGVTLGTLDLASGTITGTTGVLSSNSWTVYNGTISAIIAGGTAPLTKSTPGTVVLTRPNQYVGATTVSAGVLEIQDNYSLGTIDGITTVSAGATLQIDGTSLSIPEYITFSGTGHLYAGAIRNSTGDNTLTGLLTLGAAARIVSDTGTTLTIDSKGLSATTLGLTIGGAGNTTFTSTAPIYGTTATLTKQDAGTLTMEAFNNFTGATNINYGEVILSGAGAMPLSTTMTISTGASLTLNNTDSTEVVDRLADSLALTMNGGNFNFIGSDSIDVDETVGVLTSGIANQSGNNIITITPGSGGSTTMQFASLTRTAGSSLLFRGTSLGADPGPDVSTLLFKTAPTLTGGGGAPNSTTLSIIAGAFGDDSLTGTGTDMVTYGRGNSNGLRLLNGAGFSGEYAFTMATNANVKLSTTTVAATSSINSLILSGSANITDAGTSQTITLVSGNILNLVSNNTIAGANTTIAGGSVELNILTPSNISISSLITTSGGLTKSGAGTLTFSTAKTYTGLTSINEGTLLYGINDAISSGAVTVNGGTLDISTFSDTVGAVILQKGTITGSSGVLTSSASFSFREGTVSAIIGGASGITVTRIATNTAPDSVVLLTRDNTYAGVTAISSGILRLGGAGGGTNTPLGTTGNGTTIASGAALDLNGFTLGTAETITSLSGTGFGPSGSSNMGAIMNSSGTPVSYSGNITMAAASRINADYGALTFGGNLSGAFAFTSGGFSNSTYTGVIGSGALSVTKDGIGTLTLSGNNSYTGATTISSGTVKLGATGSGSNTPLGTTAGITTVALGARLDLNGYTLVTAEPLTLNGVGYGLGDFASGALMNSSASAVTYSGLLTLGSVSTIKVDSGDINLSAAGTITGATFALTLGGTGNGTLASIIGTTTGTVTKIGTGTWTLSGASTYTGATRIDAGTLKIGATGATTNTPLGVIAGATTVSSGAVLDLNGFTLTAAEPLTVNGRGINDGGAVVNSGGALAYSGAITQATDSRITNSGSGLLTITGGVTGAFALYLGGTSNMAFSTGVLGMGAGTLTKQGSGTVTATGTHTYTGATRIDAGTFAYGSNVTVLAATPLTVLGGVFDMAGSTDTIGSLTLVGGTIQNGTLSASGNYTMEGGTVSAVLAGGTQLLKYTNNTLTLTAANTYTLGTTINAGTLVLSGSGSAVSSTFTINPGGTLTLDNSSTSVASRLGDALALTMNGGNFNFIGNSAGASSETTGTLTLFNHNTVTVTPGAGGSTTMTFASFSRQAGATVLFRGTNLGSNAAANVSTLIFTTSTGILTGAGGAANSTTASVIKGAFGDSSLSGTGSDMVTYNLGNTNGLRLLNGAGFSGEYAGDLQTANANVKLTADRAAVATNTNSLILNGFGITNPGGAITIPISSASLAGNILINSANNIAGANTTLGITTNELDILATANSTISAVIGTATTGSVVLSGTGNVTLSATNLYTGITYVNNATLTAGASNVISSGGVTIVGGTYDLNGNSDTVGAISLTAGTITTGAGTLTGNGSFATWANSNVASIITGNLGLGANATFTIPDGLMDNDAVISAVISGGFTFGKAGAGVLMLSGSNTYSGATTISAGTLRLGAAGGATNTPLGTTAGGTTVSTTLDLNGYTLGTAEGLTLNAGTLTNTSSNAATYSGLITLGATGSNITSNYGDIDITNTGNITGNTFTLAIGGAGNGSLASNLNTSTGTLTKNGVGVWTISGGASTFTGLTTISAGTLKLGSAGSGSNTPLGTNAGGVTVTSGAIFDLNGYTLATAEPIGSLSGTGITSTGAFINSSNNSVSYSGSIILGSGSRIVNYGSGVMTLTGNISGNFALTAVTVGGITQSSTSVWSGTGTLIKEGSGTLILAGQNTMTGAMTVSTGKLQLGASGGATNTPLGTNAGGVTVSAGAVLDLSTFNLGGASTYETLNLTGTGIKNTGALISSSSGSNNFGAMTVTTNARVINSGSGTITFGGTITAAASVNFGIGGTGPVTISGVYGATATTATITKWDSGILTIGAASITTGLVRINGGTFKYNIADALATPAVTVAGGTWDLNGFSEGGTTVLGAVTLIDGSIVNTGGAATITSSAAYTVENGTISAVLAGAAIAMNKNTGGTVTLSAANTFAGLTTINAGTLAWGINDALSSGNLTVTGGYANLGTRTDTVGTVTLTSGGITGSSGILTGTSYAMQSGTVSAKLAGSIALAKTTVGTLILSGNNDYTGTTTITAGAIRANSSEALGDESGTNTLIFNGGTLQAGGDISSPSGRAVTLTSSGLIDTNGYTIAFAGTVGSASGFTKYGTGTLTTSGATTLGNAMSITHGTYNQAGSLSMTSGTVTIASPGTWSNVGTGAVTLAGAVSNSGVITLNSNNGSQCVDGANSILVRSSVNNTLRSWSGTGTFNLYNLDVDDMSGTITAYYSTLSGDTTWTNSPCLPSVSGTSNGAGTVRIAVNGVLAGQTATIGGGTWNATGLTITTGQVVVAWIDNVADNLESTAISKYDGTGDMTGMVLNTGVLSLGSVDSQSLSLANLDLYDCSADEDIMYSVISNVLNVEGQSCAGSVNNAYSEETLSTLASNTLTIATAETITTEKINNTGVMLVTGSPTFNVAGTSGTLITNTGTFLADTSVVNLTGNGDATINSGSPTFYDLTISGTGVKSLGAGLTLDSGGDLTVSTGTFNPATYLLNGLESNTLTVASGATLNVDASTFAGNYSSGFATVTLDANSTVNYNLAGTQTIGGLTYGHLSISGSGTKTLGGNTQVAGNLTVSAGTLELSSFNFNASNTSGIISITGTLSDTNVSGTNTLAGDVTINSGAIWTTSNDPAFNFGGSLTNDSSSGFTSGAGVYSFNSADAETISGSQAFTITNLTNNITAATGLTFSGNQPVVDTLTQGVNAILTFSGTVPSISTISASTDPNTILYTGNSPTIKVSTVYHNLVIDSTGSSSLNGGITMYGDFTLGANATVNLGNMSIFVAGSTSLSGTFNITNSGGVKDFTGPVTLNSGSVWNNSANGNVFFHGGLTNNSSAGFTSGSGTYTFDSAAQTISGSQPFTITNLASSVTSSTGLTFSGAQPSVDNLTQAAYSILTFAGTLPAIKILDADAIGNVVNYTSGSAQTIASSAMGQIGNSLSLGGNAGPPALSSLSSSRVAFVDAFLDSLRAYDFDGTDWSQVGNALGIGTVGYPALTKLTSTRIAFVDSAGAQLRTYDFNGTNWSQVGNSFSIGGIVYPFLTGLSSNTVAFVDDGNDSLRTYEFDGTNWSQVGSSLSISNVDWPALATISSDTIAFVDHTNEQLRTYKFDGNTWSQVGNSFSLGSINVPALTALSSNRVAFLDSQGGKIKLYDFDGTDWSLNGNTLTINNNSVAITAMSPTRVGYVDSSTDEIRTYDVNETKYFNLVKSGAGTAALSGDITVDNDLTISGGTFNTNSKTLTLGGNYNNSGTFTAGNGLVNFTAGDSGNTITGTMTGSSKFNNITFDNTDGEWTFGGNAVEVLKNFTVTNGAVTAPSNTLSVGGDFVNTPGTSGSFVHNSGTVVLNTSAKSKVVGDTTFNNFTVATDDKKVEFGAGDTFTVNGLLTLLASAYNHTINIDSTNSRDQWFINHQGTESIAYVDLNNSGCDASSTNISMGASSKDGSNNDKDCWIFPTRNQGSGGGGAAGGENSANPGEVQTGGGSGGGGGNSGGEGGGGGGDPAGGGGSGGGGGGDVGLIQFPGARLLAFMLFNAYKSWQI